MSTVAGRAFAAAVPGIDVDTTLRRRSEYAHDASNYRIVPAAVAFPRTAADVARLVAAAAAQGLPVTGRGGGTSMAGNAVGPGLVIDLSAHLTVVTSIDPAARTAVVEAGTVLDTLRRRAAAHGLTFGPDPSSHSRATLGGMIGNDACGNHSVVHGRTADHLHRLDVVLADGTRVAVHADRLEALDADGADRVAALERALRDIGERYSGVIRAGLDRFGRQVSGYQLHHLLPGATHFARSLAGSEGTCALVTSATVGLVPAPAAPVLVVAGYADVRAAAADVPAVLAHAPAAVEGMDEPLVRMLHGDGPGIALRRLPPGRAWLLVELDRGELAASERAAAELVAELTAAGGREARVVTDPAGQRRLWSIREDGAGLAARTEDGRTYWPGWEDAAVPPDRLAAYLGDFIALRERHRLGGAIYGHFGAGCVHTRIDFDLAGAAGREAMAGFLADAARLVVRHGGSLSGEHGDGRARSALLPVMYPPEMLRAFDEFAAAWDPGDRLNPRVIVRPDRPTDHLIAIAPAGPPRPSAFAFPRDPGGLRGAVDRCVGIGKCRSAAGGVMCPSFRATGDERDSTRGRARVLQELLDGPPDAAPGERAAAVLDALDLCLACKACSTDCPTGVDMATYKSEFLHRHYRRRWRPASHLTLGWAPLWFRLAARLPAVANRILGVPAVRRLGARLAGVTTERDLPAFARAPSWPAPPGPRSLLLVDTFTGSFRPSVVTAARRVLGDAGLPAAVAPRGACCALPWISTGQLSVARRVLRRTARLLDRAGPPDAPIVVPEPSCAAALREDLPRLVPGERSERVAARVQTLAGALATYAPGWRPARVAAGPVVQQVHCHEYATFGRVRQRDLLTGWGFGVETAEGCCGLAGNFGFERRHYEVSLQVAGQGLTPALDRRPDAPLLADGFSCYLQAAHVRGRAALHLAELLAGGAGP
ncbi:FAD-binding and (Fe-S)-binding domain-containing protein [Dactylosporangium sp. CA-092794]|uniref:FAD-binding and (Fe-S)-binding domain-containing protein n=1 Tax=Dactylosporangium sp. CA-092794 TaxID=3239929 RepID=UPI003D9463B6